MGALAQNHMVGYEFTVQEIVKGKKILEDLRQASGEDVSSYNFHEYVIKSTSLQKGIKYYDVALRIYMGAVIKRRLKVDPTLSAPTTDTGLGDWADLSGLLLPESEEQRLADDIKQGVLDTVDKVNERFHDIHTHYRDYQWVWTYRLILDYYGLATLTLEDAARIHDDYVQARRAWINEIRKDAEKEFRMGDVEQCVLDNFLSSLDKETDFEEQ